MIDNGAVFPMFYLPPIEYFVKLNTYKPEILIEREEHFPKQTYRNRANIYSPDGVLALIVPVVRGAKNHTKVKDVKISYDFEKFYEKKSSFLFDYNEQLLQFILKSIKLKVELKYTESYEAEYPFLAD